MSDRLSKDLFLRRALVSDAPAIAMVHIASWRESYSELLPKQLLANLSLHERAKQWKKLLAQPYSIGAAVFVAELEDEIIGFASSGRQRDPRLQTQGITGEITSIYVLQRAKRMNVGRRLMLAIGKALQSGGHASASLWVLRDNVPARQFYEALGGHVVAQVENRHDDVGLPEVAYAWRDLSDLITLSTK